MTDHAKALPKSLHTVTALIAMASTLKAHAGHSTNESAVAASVTAFGLDGRPDDYGLASAAVKCMDAADLKRTK